MQERPGAEQVDDDDDGSRVSVGWWGTVEGALHSHSLRLNTRPLETQPTLQPAGQAWRGEGG